jgi:hypothetical protein
VRTELRSKDAALKEVFVASGVWPLFKYKARGDYGTPYMDYSSSIDPEDMAWVVWQDLNADGWFDRRLVKKGRTKLGVQIWLNDQWVLTTRGIKGPSPSDFTVVTDQGAYRFSAGEGRWVETQDLPSADQNVHPQTGENSPEKKQDTAG